jgi:hypothetical protein
MGIAKLYGQKASGTNINGIIKDYHAYAGENISAGDLVEYINGMAGQTTGTSVDTVLNNTSNFTGYIISAIVLDEKRVFIAHRYLDSSNSNHLYGMVCTIDGTTITAGIDTYISDSLAYNGSISAVKLDENRVFVAFSYSGEIYLYGIVCTIDGTIITKGTYLELASNSYAGYAISAQLLPNGNISITHSRGSGYSLFVIVCTISGSTITKGTDTLINSSERAGFSISTCSLLDGKIFIAHSYNISNYYLYGIVCTISGTTITAGSDTALNTTTARTGEKISTTLLPDGKVFVASSYSTSYYLYGTICSVSGTSISKGANIQISANTYASFALSATTLPDGNVFIACCTDSSNFYLYGVVCTVSDTTFSAGTTTKLSEDRYTGYKMSAITLNNGTIFIAHNYSTNYHLYAQIFGVSNNIPTNNVPITEYETQVRKTTTSKFDGVAKTSGVGGTTTAPKDYVSIYTL